MIKLHIPGRSKPKSSEHEWEWMRDGPDTDLFCRYCYLPKRAWERKPDKYAVCEKEESQESQTTLQTLKKVSSPIKALDPQHET